MNMLRGAAAFLVFLAVFAFSECKSANDPAIVSGAMPRNSAQIMTKSKVKPLPCLGNDTLCHGDMCTVELQVGLDDDDEKDVVHAPARVYVVDSQKIVWTATSYQANDTDVPMVTEVSFTALGSGKDAPSPAASATCSAGVCTVYGTNFDTCGVYKYSVVVKHHKKNKKADPELEVAGTTTVSPTGTSGTTGTTGTR